MRLYRPCFFEKHFFPEALFREKTTEKVIYLTFDDGPDVNSTIPLLKILDRNQIKAVFFCSGKAAFENPDLITFIKSAGHVVGNHGYNHLDGFFTSKQKYLDDINRASLFTSETLMRPPYGRIRMSQYSELVKSYRIIFWDIMPYDFEQKFGSARSLSILKKLIRPGSVIALHDKPDGNVLKFIEDFIAFAKVEDYRFDIIPATG
jgi:peptidoglycan/xylan/chitin deacetylase (PgdA/CDA1 family)